MGRGWKSIEVYSTNMDIKGYTSECSERKGRMREKASIFLNI
jgi:hypothetical protein